MNQGPFTLALVGWFFMAVVMIFLYLVQRARKDAGIVDVGWAGGMGLLAIFYAVMVDGDLPRRIVLAILARSRSFRLASHFRRGNDGSLFQLRHNLRAGMGSPLLPGILFK